MDSIKKIAITGPESTGKSTLARQLAEHYKTVWVPEYARTYINQLNRPYERYDLMEMAKGQISQEEKLLLESNNFLFCDTELSVIKIWGVAGRQLLLRRFVARIHGRSYPGERRLSLLPFR